MQYRHLADDAGSGVDVDCVLRADADARGVGAAVLAHDGDEGRVAPFLDTVNAHPGEALAVVRLWQGRHVVFDGAGDHAGAAAVASIEIDDHAVAGGLCGML